MPDARRRKQPSPVADPPAVAHGFDPGNRAGFPANFPAHPNRTRPTDHPRAGAAAVQTGTDGALRRRRRRENLCHQRWHSQHDAAGRRVLKSDERT